MARQRPGLQTPASLEQGVRSVLEPALDILARVTGTIGLDRLRKDLKFIETIILGALNAIVAPLTVLLPGGSTLPTTVTKVNELQVALVEARARITELQVAVVNLQNVNTELQVRHNATQKLVNSIIQRLQED
jgi:hypothetical protein